MGCCPSEIKTVKIVNDYNQNKKDKEYLNSKLAKNRQETKPNNQYLHLINSIMQKIRRKQFELTQKIVSNIKASQITGKITTSDIYNSFETESKNIFWGAGLSLAWKEFKNVLQVDQIILNSSNPQVKPIVQNFNNCVIDKSDIDQSSFVIKSGFGDQAIQQINEQVSKKFPKRNMQLLQKIGKSEYEMIVLYTFFMKNLNFRQAFSICQEKMLFKGVGKIKAFEALVFKQKQQILIHKYENQNNFMIQLLFQNEKNGKDELYLIKNQKSCQKVQETVLLQGESQNMTPQRMIQIDLFKMPFVNMQAKCTHEQLIGAKVLSSRYGQIGLSKIHETINLKIDEKGVAVENEGVIEGQMQSCLIYDAPPKKLIFDSQFWIVMKEKGKHPYLVIKVANPTHG